MHRKSATASAPTTVETVERSLRAVWAESLPSVAFDLETSWRDLGIDSLRALEFILRLERALGRKISTDGMEAESTAGDLLHRLASDLDPSSRSLDRRARMFFVPGLGGDDQAQAEFRRAFRREVTFDVLYLDAAETHAWVLGDIAARADVLARQVDLRQPTGDIRLAGYSHGAVVAQEMAARLEAAGRVVALLVVLDGMLTPPLWMAPPRAGEEVRLVPRRRERLKGLLGPIVGPILQRLRIFELARRFLSIGWLRDLAWARTQNRRLLRAWGHVSIIAWRPTPCAAPTLIIASDDFSTFSTLEGWRKICPCLNVVQVPGDHYNFLRTSGVAAFEAAFLEALAGSISE